VPQSREAATQKRGCLSRSASPTPAARNIPHPRSRRSGCGWDTRAPTSASSARHCQSHPHFWTALQAWHR
jgi:hypothetical protein